MKIMESIKAMVARMHESKSLFVRQPRSISWGDREYCETLFVQIFRSVDLSVERYEHLPEYEQIVDWMHNTGGKGLLMMGDCGRGKSIIATCVIPVLLKMQSKGGYAVHAEDFDKPYPFATSTEGCDPKAKNIDYLAHTSFPIIDELGVEPRCNNFGERFEGFNRIINNAERYLKPVFITTNLTKLELLDRYGERTIDRLMHLCRIVEFKGDSLR